MRDNALSVKKMDLPKLSKRRGRPSRANLLTKRGTKYRP
jgi:hypothetical protein